MNDTYNLFKQKLNILQNIYDLTISYKFSGNNELEQKEISDYSLLMEKRQLMFDEIFTLDNKISLLDNNLFNNENAYLQDIKIIAKKIFELDNDNNKTMKKIYSSVQTTIKEINHGKSLNNLYNNDFVSNSNYSYDRSN